MDQQINISVVIPTLNEAQNIGKLIHWLRKTSGSINCEVLVVDGGSKDGTVEKAMEAGAITVNSPRKGRSVQMNTGARMAGGRLLYFVHADVLPPVSWATDVIRAIREGYHAGCFSYRFDSNSRLLRLNARLTRLNSMVAGGGDQTLFVKREVFEELRGFKDHLLIMEDFDLVWRLKRKFSFVVICNDALVSARKYRKNSYLYVQLINFLTVLLFRMGFSQGRLRKMYKTLMKVR